MIYIGCHITEKIEDGYIGSGTYLRRVIKKYGKEIFSREVLFYCASLEDMLEKEEEIVNEAFVSRLDTYNLTIGGYGGGFYYINSNELNNIAGQCHIVHNKIKEDEEYREWYCKKVSNGLKLYYENNEGTFKGKKHTKESKKKIGAANSVKQKGSGNSQFGTMWITDGVNNMKVLKDTEISENWRKGRVINK